MKKTLQALSFLIIAMGMSGASAVDNEDIESGEHGSIRSTAELENTYLEGTGNLGSGDSQNDLGSGSLLIYQYKSSVTVPDFSRDVDESAYDYVIRMNKLWIKYPKHRIEIEETLENDRKKQEDKWNNASFFGKTKEIFMANPYDSTAAIGFTVLGYTMGWWVPQMFAIAFDIYTGTKNYALAKGSKKNLLFGIGFSWSPPA